jgi:hypothetical protein
VAGLRDDLAVEDDPHGTYLPDVAADVPTIFAPALAIYGAKSVLIYFCGRELADELEEWTPWIMR